MIGDEHTAAIDGSGQFDVASVAINQDWVGDITYIPTRDGFVYLATVLYLGSRRGVG